MKLKHFMLPFFCAAMLSCDRSTSSDEGISKIDNIHEQIEMAATRLEGLEHQSAYSTVNINYYQLLDEVSPNEDAGIAPGFGNRILSAAANGGSWIPDLFIGLIGVWPLLLAGSLVVYCIRKKQWQIKQAGNKNTV